MAKSNNLYDLGEVVWAKEHEGGVLSKAYRVVNDDQANEHPGEVLIQWEYGNKREYLPESLVESVTASRSRNRKPSAAAMFVEQEKAKAEQFRQEEAAAAAAAAKAKRKKKIEAFQKKKEEEAAAAAAAIAKKKQEELKVAAEKKHQEKEKIKAAAAAAAAAAIAKKKQFESKVAAKRKHQEKEETKDGAVAIKKKQARTIVCAADTNRPDEGHNDNDNNNDNTRFAERNCCNICGDGGDLLVCYCESIKDLGCGRVFHVGCIKRKEVPKGDWVCRQCANDDLGLDSCGVEGYEFFTKQKKQKRNESFAHTPQGQAVVQQLVTNQNRRTGLDNATTSISLFSEEGRDEGVEDEINATITQFILRDLPDISRASVVSVIDHVEETHGIVLSHAHKRKLQVHMHRCVTLRLQIDAKNSNSMQLL